MSITDELNGEVISLVTLQTASPALDFVADDFISRLQSQCIGVERVNADELAEQNSQDRQPEVLLASVDTFVAQWGDNDSENERDSATTDLLNSLTPLAGVVRDHQAFVMLQKEDVQALRSRFAMAPGASGPMVIGGFSAAGQTDHLVAMMLMEAVGQDAKANDYRQYGSLQSMARALLAGEIELLSIPVSQALQMPFDDNITIVATSGDERQDVTINVPTLLETQVDMKFTNHIGLFTSESGAMNETVQLLASVMETPEYASQRWPERICELGLVDDYIDEGEFGANMRREFATLKHISEMLD